MSPGKIFGEYIKLANRCPVEIINNEISEFHFILASASDQYDPSTKKGTGNFQKNWNVDTFSAESIKNLKSEKQNMKVVISIGGRGSDSPATFDPENKSQWIKNAKKSLETIIFVDYKSDDPGSTTVIDGIDIAYESIESHANEFAQCMGEVIEELKMKSNGSLVVSIAPSLDVIHHYETLYNQDKTSAIRSVNYKYYCEKLYTKEDFLNRYKDVVSKFPAAEKQLAGYSTDPKDKHNILPVKVFFDACSGLIKTGKISGIFVWYADDSEKQHPSFSVEEEAQRVILHPESESHSDA